MRWANRFAWWYRELRYNVCTPIMRIVCVRRCAAACMRHRFLGISDISCIIILQRLNAIEHMHNINVYGRNKYKRNIHKKNVHELTACGGDWDMWFNFSNVLRHYMIDLLMRISAANDDTCMMITVKDVRMWNKNVRLWFQVKVMQFVAVVTDLK